MDAWVVPVATATLSTVGAFVSVWYGTRAARVERRNSAEELAIRFREPLLQAVFNLETRVYNIVKLDFFGRFLAPESTPGEKEYAELNTLYLFAQYFCWVEIIRRESQFVDPRNIERNRAVAHTLEAVRDTLAESVRIPDRTFRLFRGEQRALGELMLVPVTETSGSVPRWECLGYAAFVGSLDEAHFARWFTRLRADIAAHVSDGSQLRLCLVQGCLMDIVEELDPEMIRIPQQFRERLVATGDSGKP
ncbi:hypothetical protein [Pengzhenrongella sp.]|jgi:hypothetical protein|uniref:hypothetical protein n=1 Tax=Pengzhenrongella sp. TaxID=2888820 RepID=UPI002F92CE92